jgi:hypothetical protein
MFAAYFGTDAFPRAYIKSRWEGGGEAAARRGV